MNLKSSSAANSPIYRHPTKLIEFSHRHVREIMLMLSYICAYYWNYSLTFCVIIIVNYVLALYLESTIFPPGAKIDQSIVGGKLLVCYFHSTYYGVADVDMN